MCGLFAIIKKSNTLFKDYQEDLNQADEFYAAHFGVNKTYSAYTPTVEETFLKSILYATMIRGEDATGFAMVCPIKKNYRNLKLPVNAMQFSKFTEYLSVENHLNIARSVVIGHCRAGTTGGNSVRTSHPFGFDSLTGVHNGTLSQWKHLIDNAASDSEALYGALNQTPEENYTKFLSELNGSYSLIWYNKHRNSLYFARNNDRPLSVLETKDSIILASEGAAIEYASLRAIKDADKRNAIFSEGNYYDTPANVLHELSLETYEINKEEIPKKVFYSVSPIPANKGNVNHYTYIPISKGETVPLIPLGIEVDDKKNNIIYGYIPRKDKNYYFQIFGVKRAQELVSAWAEMLLNATEADVTGEVEAAYQVDSKSRYDFHKRNSTDLITGVKIYPEMTNDFYYYMSIINKKSLSKFSSYV